jgi:hypothetical protein
MLTKIKDLAVLDFFSPSQINQHIFWAHFQGHLSISSSRRFQFDKLGVRRK